MTLSVEKFLTACTHTKRHISGHGNQLAFYVGDAKQERGKAMWCQLFQSLCQWTYDDENETSASSQSCEIDIMKIIKSHLRFQCLGLNITALIDAEIQKPIVGLSRIRMWKIVNVPRIVSQFGEFNRQR